MWLKWWWPAILWALFIFFLCSIPGKDLPSADWMSIVSFDKWAHLGVFSMLSGLILHGLSEGKPQKIPTGSRLLWWMIAAVGFGALTEAYQHYALEDRYADIFDFAANTLGVLLGLWFYQRYARAIYRKRK